MFSLIKQVFIVLLSFSELFATKCLSLTDEPCMIWYSLIDLNPVVLKYYPFMISLDCSVVEVVMSYHQIFAFQKNKRHKC